MKSGASQERHLAEPYSHRKTRQPAPTSKFVEETIIFNLAVQYTSCLKQLRMSFSSIRYNHEFKKENANMGAFYKERVNPGMSYPHHKAIRPLVTIKPAMVLISSGVKARSFKP